jgi:muconate cycloisomerase
MAGDPHISAVDVWQVRIPLARPYHLSKTYGTLTHSDAALLRLTLADGTEGWGEADPGGINFDGETIDTVIRGLREHAAGLPGCNPGHRLRDGDGAGLYGAVAAAIDVACHDALARSRGIPVYDLLGGRRRDAIDVLWPTSSGSAADDLDVIAEFNPRGFDTYMLKMGDRPVDDDISRAAEVSARLPAGVRVMVDANQGWQRDEALRFAVETRDLPLILIEQPVAAADLDGLRAVREAAACPVSVDESVQRRADVGAILRAAAADVFSVKISKNGGLAASRAIAREVGAADKKVLMNSMIELGITQAASLQLGCTLDNLMDCGHAYMSTLRMADDITDFSNRFVDGRAHLAATPGLGIEVSLDKIRQYEVEHFHVG